MSNLTTASGVTNLGKSGIADTLAVRVFSPWAQAMLLQYPRLAYDEKSGVMTLAKLVEVYGRPAIVVAIQAAIVDLARFVGGSPEPQTIMEVAGQCAGIMISDFCGYKPSEISLFCARFKRGDYGEQFKFTGSAIMTAWRQFTKERNEERYRLAKEEERRKTNEALNSPDVITDPERISVILTSALKKR